MAITFVGVSALTGSGSWSPPGSWQAGDLAIIYTVNTVTSGDWKGGIFLGGGTGNSNVMYYRVLQAGDTTWSGAIYGKILTYRGVDPLYPFSGIVIGGTGTSTSPAAPALAVPSTSLVLTFQEGGTATAVPSGTTQRGTFGGQNVAENNSTGSYSGGTWTTSNYIWQTASVALRPDDAARFPFVADQDTTSGTVTSNSSSWTLTYPTNIAAGDLLLALVSADGGAGYVSTLPSGWVLGYELNASANMLSWAKKLADGSETGTFSASMGASEQGAWIIYRIPAGTWEGTLGTVFSNASGSGSVVKTNTVTGSPSLNPDPPSLDPVNWATENTLWFAVTSVDTSRTVSGYPSGMTNTGSLVSGGSTGATLAWARLESAVASYDPGTFTISASDDWAVATIAIRPALTVIAPPIRGVLMPSVHRAATI